VFDYRFQSNSQHLTLVVSVRVVWQRPLLLSLKALVFLESLTDRLCSVSFDREVIFFCKSACKEGRKYGVAMQPGYLTHLNTESRLFAVVRLCIW